MSESESEYHQVHWSSESDEWATPPELLRPLDRAVSGFDLDPCSGAEERSIATDTYTEEEDGLAQHWFGSVWCNPPYSDVESWMEKARNEGFRQSVDTVLVLVPARTSTSWFHEYAADAPVMCFLEGRLSFGESDNSAPFPSMLVAYGDVPDRLQDVLADRGAVYRHGERYQPTLQTTLTALEEGSA